MKRVTIVLVLVLMVVSICSCYAIIKYFDYNTAEQYSKLMHMAYESIYNTPVEEVLENDITEEIIGVLEIEKLEVKAPIKEGTNQEVLKYAIGHFEESDIWNGNVALASHNRGSYAHYFKDIDKLENGDQLTYITSFGTRTYSVVEKVKISETNWNKVLENIEENTLTLVTCITGEREYRLCIKAIEL